MKALRLLRVTNQETTTWWCFHQANWKKYVGAAYGMSVEKHFKTLEYSNVLHKFFNLRIEFWKFLGIFAPMRLRFYTHVFTNL